MAALLLAALLAGCSFDDETLFSDSGPASADDGSQGAEGPPSLAALVQGTAAPSPPGGGAALVGRIKPLAVIRFEQPDVEIRDVDYRGKLFATLSDVLRRRPNAGFEVVAVTPRFDAAASAAAGAEASDVIRALAAMGLPAERLSLSATTAPQAQGREVHLYVR